MRKNLTSQENNVIRMYHAGMVYQFPIKVAETYRLNKKLVSPEEVFADINKKHTKPGALLRGIRIRENMIQTEIAKLIKVTQSDISQMENGTRNVGRSIARRIEKVFGVDY